MKVDKSLITFLIYLITRWIFFKELLKRETKTITGKEEESIDLRQKQQQEIRKHDGVILHIFNEVIPIFIRIFILFIKYFFVIFWHHNQTVIETFN